MGLSETLPIHTYHSTSIPDLTRITMLCRPVLRLAIFPAPPPRALVGTSLRAFQMVRSAQPDVSLVPDR